MTVDETYFDLIKRFPLESIQDDAHLEAALDVLDELSLGSATGTLSPGAAAYYDVLRRLIHDYESIKFPIEKYSPLELVKALMEVNSLTQADLEREFGSKSRVSEFLSGKRDLSKEQIARLATRFSLSPAAFFTAAIEAEQPRFSLDLGTGPNFVWTSDLVWNPAFTPNQSLPEAYCLSSSFFSEEIVTYTLPESFHLPYDTSKVPMLDWSGFVQTNAPGVFYSSVTPQLQKTFAKEERANQVAKLNSTAAINNETHFLGKAA
jgi:HTH-type transcriptional regulator / antitoxin HigA